MLAAGILCACSISAKEKSADTRIRDHIVNYWNGIDTDSLDAAAIEAAQSRLRICGPARRQHHATRSLAIDGKNSTLGPTGSWSIIWDSPTRLSTPPPCSWNIFKPSATHCLPTISAATFWPT